MQRTGRRGRLRTSWRQHCQCVECVAVDRDICRDALGRGRGRMLTVAKITQGSAAGTRSTWRARRRPASWATTTSRTVSGSKHQDGGLRARRRVGCDPELPVTGEQLQGADGRPPARHRRAAAPRRRHRRGGRRARRDVLGAEVGQRVVGGRRPRSCGERSSARTSARSTARSTTRSSTWR